jgi:hypothetical protein
VSRKVKIFDSMDYKGCVVVQGPTHSKFLDMIRFSWEGYQIIFSTWNTTNKRLYNKSDIVIYNPIPETAGVKNLNYQKVSTINGLLKAKELGWERALKVRSDMTTTTADGLFNLFDKSKLNLHGYWGPNSKHSYITDFFMEGEIDDIINLFEDDSVVDKYPEWHLTKKLYDSGLNKKSVCVCKKLAKDVADIKWESRSYWFSLHAKPTFNNITDVLPVMWSKKF